MMGLTHWKSPWCWEGLGTEGEEGSRGWDGITDAMDMNLGRLQEMARDREACCSLWDHKESDMTGWLNNMCWVFSHSWLFVAPWTTDHQAPLFVELSRLLCPWNFPGKTTGAGCQTPLQGIAPTQGSSPCLLHLLRWQVHSLPPFHLGLAVGAKLSTNFLLMVL